MPADTSSVKKCLYEVLHTIFDEVKSLEHRMKLLRYNIFVSKKEETLLNARIQIISELKMKILDDIKTEIEHQGIKIAGKRYLRDYLPKLNDENCLKVLNKLHTEINSLLTADNPTLKTHFYQDRGLFNFINSLLKMIHKYRGIKTTSEKALESSMEQIAPFTFKP